MSEKSSRIEGPVRPPRLAKKMQLRDIMGGYVQYHERYTSLALSGLDLSNQVAVRPAFDEGLFNQVKFSNTEFEEIQLDDVRCVDCDFAAAVWYKSTWHRVELIGCRLTGFLAGEAQLEDVLFKDCLISLAQFRFSRFKSVRFENCDLTEVDFLEADFSNVQFVQCNLRQAEFSGTRLADIDLSSCTIASARLGAKELQGATLNIAQAIALVESMGIKIQTPKEGEEK